MRTLTEIVDCALVHERAKAILAILFVVGFPSLEDEEVANPEEATVFVRSRASHDCTIEIFVKVKVEHTDAGWEPIGDDALAWARLNHALHLHGHWDTIGPPDSRDRIPFVISVRHTTCQIDRAQPLPEYVDSHDCIFHDPYPKRCFRASGWKEIEATRVWNDL